MCCLVVLGNRTQWGHIYHKLNTVLVSHNTFKFHVLAHMCTSLPPPPSLSPQLHAFIRDVIAER